MKKRKRGSREVGAIGLGCMSMSGIYGAGDEESRAETLVRAVELGVTLFDPDNVQGDRYGDRMAWLRSSDIYD